MIEDLLKTEVVTVGQLLQYSKLAIPIYQRPYKWSPKNVLQLIKDVYTFRNISAYRLGTVVIHNDGTYFNIVDGQQRIITLLLIAQAMFVHQKHKIKNPELRKLLQSIETSMINPDFGNDISVANIRANYQLIEREVITFDEELILFLLTKCEVIQFVLTDVSEAFQFFDAQNARGRDLEPHDLLKAFHLREFAEEEDQLKSAMVDTWEKMQTRELSGLFSNFLFRIKSWSKLRSARFFSKSEVELFKGVNIDKLESFPYALSLRITHHFVDHYNQNYERLVDRQKMPYPFQLDQSIINGRRFFEMIAHYKKVFDDYRQHSTNASKLNETAIEIMETLNIYEGRNRIGDEYVRMLFDCTLLFYIDKFEYKDINKAIEKIFIWSYRVRLDYQNVQMASVDNYVLEGVNLFRVIKDATSPDELFSVYIEPVEANYSTKTRDIEKLFKKLKYYGRSATTDSDS